MNDDSLGLCYVCVNGKGFKSHKDAARTIIDGCR